MDRDRDALLHAYLAGPGAVRAAASGMDRAQLQAHPIPGKWSSLELVCHLVDADLNIAHRIRRVLTEDRPAFDRFRPDAMPGALAYQSRDVEEELALLDLGRRQLARILRASPPAAWDRAGVVGDRGDRDVARMIDGAIGHVAHHLPFLYEKRRALGLGDPAGDPGISGA